MIKLIHQLADFILHENGLFVYGLEVFGDIDGGHQTSKKGGAEYDLYIYGFDITGSMRSTSMLNLLACWVTSCEMYLPDT